MLNSRKLISAWIGDTIRSMNNNLSKYQATCCCIDLLGSSGKASGKCYRQDCNACISQFLSKDESENESMYLVHYKLIPYLPTKLLLEQWSFCLKIAEQLHRKGEPDELALKPINKYPLQQFRDFCNMIAVELSMNRGITPTDEDFKNLGLLIGFEPDMLYIHRDIFKGWHTDLYMTMCLSNLMVFKQQGIISESDWEAVKGAPLYESEVKG